MSFQSGVWLFAGLAACAAVILLHRLRPRRQAVIVSSLFLWREVERELAAGRKRRRLLSSLLLLAQLGGIATLSLALAGPTWHRRVPPAHVAVIVDTSASMSVPTPAGHSRYEEALLRVRRLMATGEVERYTLIATTGEALRYDGPSRRGFLEALAALPPPLGPSRWDAAAQALRAVVEPGRSTALILATDGALDPALLEPLRAAVGRGEAYVIEVGDAVANVAITEFSARAVTAGEYQFLLRIANDGPEPRTVRVLVSSLGPLPSPGAAQPARDAISLYDGEVVLAPFGRESILLNHSPAPGEALEARLEFEGVDPLPADNAAYLLVGKDDPVRVLHVGLASPLIEQSLRALEKVVVDDTLLLDPPAELSRQYDLVVFYDAPVPPHFQGNALELRSRAAASEAGPARPAQITWWNQTHPLSRFVAWESVTAGPARGIALTPGEQVLVDSTVGPLVTVAQRETSRVVRVAIPLEQSDFPFRVAYPVFLHNVILWAGGAKSQGIVAPLPPGSLPPEARAGDSAGGGGVTLSRLASRMGTFSGERLPAGFARDPAPLTAEPGVYSWESSEGSGHFAVSLLSAEESNLMPRLGSLAAWRAVSAQLTLPDIVAAAVAAQGPVPERAQPGPLSRSLFALVALLLLAAESFLYMQRYRAAPSAVPSFFHVREQALDGPRRPLHPHSAPSGKPAGGISR